MDISSNVNNTPTRNDRRMVNCPDCGKQRLAKLMNEDGTVDAPSTNYIEVREQKRFVEACGFCQIKYEKADKKFLRDTIIKMQKAMKDGVSGDGTSGDHRDFSLDI